MASFDFSAQYILENNAALLRPLVMEDYDNLLPFSMNEKDLWKFSIAQPIGEEGLRNYLENATNNRMVGKEYPFIVTDKRSGKYAGSTRFYDIQPTNSSIQLGYTWYGKEFQGTRLNKNCKFLLMELCFDALGFERLEFQADVHNARSIAAMQSLGCTVEGVLRSHLLKPDGSRRDSIVLSILRSEWEGRIKEDLRLRIADFG